MSEIGILARNKISKEIIILGFIVIFYSLQGMPTLDFSAYYARFSPSPQKLIFARYLLSIALRVVFLVSAIGILFRKDIFRKIIIFASFFTIATVYWKHPVIIYKRILMWKIVQGTIPASMIPKIDMLAWISALICYLIDIIVAFVLIYLFTRSKIKTQFK